MTALKVETPPSPPPAADLQKPDIPGIPGSGTGSDTGAPVDLQTKKPPAAGPDLQVSQPPDAALTGRSIPDTPFMLPK